MGTFLFPAANDYPLTCAGFSKLNTGLILKALNARNKSRYVFILSCNWPYNEWSVDISQKRINNNVVEHDIRMKILSLFKQFLLQILIALKFYAFYTVLLF
jgi:hypothetical protein